MLFRSEEDLVDNSKCLADQWSTQIQLYKVGISYGIAITNNTDDTKDHLVEVLNKWDDIDDEIWAKVIIMERNQRTAKAYARAPVLTVNGSNDGYDGFRYFHFA